jgi:hypothetical protein
MQTKQKIFFFLHALDDEQKMAAAHVLSVCLV